jgi:hypothetical protein
LAEVSTGARSEAAKWASAPAGSAGLEWRLKQAQRRRRGVGLASHVVRKVDEHRPRPPGQRGAVGATQADIPGVFMQRDLGLGHRPHHRQVVELLAQGHLVHAAAVAVGDGQHRQAVEHCVRQAIRIIGHARADRRYRNAHGAGTLAIDPGCDDRRGLVLGQHELDTGGLAGADQLSGRAAAGNTEHPVDSGGLQRGKDLLCDGEGAAAACVAQFDDLR